MRSYPRATPTRTLYISYRPLRIGFLVRAGSIDDAVSAARTNTFLWGGRYNPIIPVGDDLNDARRLIADFRVDLLHRVSDDPGSAQLVEEHGHLQWPLDTGGLLAPRGLNDELEPTILDTVPAMIDSWSSVMRHRTTSRFRTFHWDPADALAPFFAVSFGEFHGDFGEYYRTVYENRLKAIVALARETDFGEHQLLSPLDVTGAELAPDFWERTRVGVVVGDPSDPAHLTAFWNLRAAGYRVDFFTDDEVLDRGLVRHVRAHIARYPERKEYERHIHLFLLLGNAIPGQLAEVLGDDAHPRHHRDIWTAWGYRQLPALFRTESHDTLVSQEVDSVGRRPIHLSLADKPFSDFDFRLTTQQWVVSVGTPTEPPLEDTLRLPYLPKLNGFYRRVAPFIHDARVELQRVGLLSMPLDNHLLLQPIASSDLIAELFKLARLTARRSGSGERARQIIAQLGHLQRCRVFRLSGVRKLLSQRVAHLGVGWGPAVQAIGEGFAEARRFYVGGEHLDQPVKVFRFLLERGIFLASYELECATCKLASLYPPRALDDEIRCPKCGARFLLAPAIRRDQWRYQLSGLLGQPEQHVFEDDREERPPEAIAVLLTLAWLHDAEAGGDLLLDTNYAIAGDNIDSEVDIVALERGQDGEVSVLLGECRTGGPMTPQDLEKLETIAGRLREAGLACHLLFATLREELGNDEVQILRELRDREQVGGQVVPRPPIILTRNDLQRGDFARADELDDYYGGELDRVAAASNTLYLG